MRVIAPIPKQFEDSNGVPYANGKVTVYLHNSTSLAQIYKEAEGGTLAPNPTILDSHGAWNAFVNGGMAYDYVVQDEHDNVIFSYSNVKAFGGGGSSNELVMFDITQASNNLYGQVMEAIDNGLLPIVTAGSSGNVRYYYYTARNEMAGIITFTCGYDGRVELLILHSDNTYEFSSVGGSSAPLVGVEIKSSGATKRFGDDGFVKANPYGVDSLYLPEPGWWLFNVRLGLRNNTARDLVQQITLEWNWNDFVEEGVPPVTYTALYPPSMQTDVDFTSTFTRQYGASAFVYKDEHTTTRWLTVRPVVYGGTPLTDTEWAVVIDIFKVRDA